MARHTFAILWLHIPIVSTKDSLDKSLKSFKLFLFGQKVVGYWLACLLFLLDSTLIAPKQENFFNSWELVISEFKLWRGLFHKLDSWVMVIISFTLDQWSILINETVSFELFCYKLSVCWCWSKQNPLDIQTTCRD